MWIKLSAFLLLCLALLSTNLSYASESSGAIILGYQRIGEDNHPDTNIQEEQFLQHMRILIDENYTILPLDKIITELPSTHFKENIIGITFDGGYASVNKIIPFLQQNKIPATFFIPFGVIEQNNTQFLNLKTLEKIIKDPLFDIQITTHDYGRLRQNNERNLEQLNLSRTTYRELFDKEAIFFSYPFGEYSLAFKELLKEQNITAAFTQNSSPANAKTDLYELPRFVMTEDYANPSRFRHIIQSHALNISNITPESPFLKTDKPRFSFMLDTINSELSCYLSQHGKLSLKISDGNRADITLPEPITQRRVRLNCTQPSHREGITTWHWFGKLYILEEESNQQQPQH